MIIVTDCYERKISLEKISKKKKLMTGIGPVTSALPRRRSTD